MALLELFSSAYCSGVHAPAPTPADGFTVIPSGSVTIALFRFALARPSEFCRSAVRPSHRAQAGRRIRLLGRRRDHKRRRHRQPVAIHDRPERRDPTLRCRLPRLIPRIDRTASLAMVPACMKSGYVRYGIKALSEETPYATTIPPGFRRTRPSCIWAVGTPHIVNDVLSTSPPMLRNILRNLAFSP